MNKKRQKMYGEKLKSKRLDEDHVLLLREEVCKVDGAGNQCFYNRYGIWVAEIKEYGVDNYGVQVFRSQIKEKAEKYFNDFK